MDNMCYIVALLIFLSPISMAETDAKFSDKYWLEMSFLAGKPDLGGAIDFKYETDKWVYAAGWSEQGDICLFCGGARQEDSFDTESYSVRLGKRLSLFNVLLEAGISKTTIETFDGLRDSTEIGVPVKLTKYFNTSHIGFGLSFGVNINSEESSYAAGFSLPLGKLK